MGYSQRLGRRPMEQASKSAHSYVVNDPEVQAFIAKCSFPRASEEIDLAKHLVLEFQPVKQNPIRHVVAVDGGFSEVAVQSKYPSSTLCFFQFGALIFSVADLEAIEDSPFIDPSDMAKLKRIQRLKLALPVRNVAIENAKTLTESVRATLHEFFGRRLDGSSLLETLKWFLFEEYGSPCEAYVLASCPSCRKGPVTIERKAVSGDGRFPCSLCKESLYLTDAFRLHEAIDDEMGAGGILGYVTTLLEQIVMAHVLRLMLSQKPSLLSELLFIKDGPLAFFGQTANMHAKMRSLVRYLFAKHDLFMVGIEKSGNFVDHAAEIAKGMKAGSALILDNEYIYKYIIPGNADPTSPYGRTTYYSNKVIFKTAAERMYVLSIPTTDAKAFPTLADLRNLEVILTNVEKLKCDMYDDALIPVALVNKLVSLANHPSSSILQRFAAEAMAQ